jgi:hypothetical protein
MDTEMQIAERAYALWEAEGHPEGRDQEFWFMAEGQLRELDEAEHRLPDDQAIVPPLAGLPIH